MGGRDPNIAASQTIHKLRVRIRNRQGQEPVHSNLGYKYPSNVLASVLVVTPPATDLLLITDWLPREGRDDECRYAHPLHSIFVNLNQRNTVDAEGTY